MRESHTQYTQNTDGNITEPFRTGGRLTGLCFKYIDLPDNFILPVLAHYILRGVDISKKTFGFSMMMLCPTIQGMFENSCLMRFLEDGLTKDVLSNDQLDCQIQLH